jgi:hypothetical protein
MKAARALLFSVPALMLVARVAQAEPEVEVHVSSRRVEVGEPFNVELDALVPRGETMPSDPVLKPPSGARIVAGPQVGMKSMFVFGQVPRIGISATWQLVASAPGHVKIPAPSVLWEGRRVAARAIEVDVVPSSGRPRSQSPFLQPGGPGGLFGGIPWPFGNASPLDDDDDSLDEGPSLDDNLELRSAPDPQIFLRAKVDKTQAVVGEQVTISFYVYHRVSAELADRRDAAMSDFVRVSMLANPGTDPPKRARAGGQVYQVRLIDRLALFPVRAGDLHTGSLRMWFTGARIGMKALRETEDLTIHVTEPPRKGRPPGYTLGDVGRFSISGTVEPRAAEQGGSVAVTLKVTGTGNFPQTLAVPERTGLEWLEPEKRESITPQGGVIAGWRSFGYVVRLKETGNVSLGKVELPYWDPTFKRYDKASVDLGFVEVKPAAGAPQASASPSASAAPGAPATADGKPDPFATLPALRHGLGSYQPAADAPLEGTRLYLALAAPPLAYGAFALVATGARQVRARRASGKASPLRLANAALADADDALARGDGKEVSAAIERAVHLAIEAATGLKSRGVLLEDLPRELVELGVPAELGEEVRATLAEASALRFDPGASAGSLGDLARRGHALVRELGRRA